jgi:hypothetical protein
MQRKYWGSALAAAMALSSGSAQAITFEFDYSLDTNNYFTAGMRQELDQVGSIFGRNLTNTFGALNNYSTTLGNLTIQNLNLPADTLRIYVGASDLSSSTLGLAYVGTALQTYGRGFGGYIQFDTIGTEQYVPDGWTMQDFANAGYTLPQRAAARNWYVDDDITTMEVLTGTTVNLDGYSLTLSKPMDFYSVAMHEMGHVLGLYHVDDSIMSTAYGEPQTVAMGPSLQAGTREYFTEADWSALSQRGWQVASLSPELVSAVPEPSGYAMLLAGLGLVGAAVRRQRRLASE